MREWMTPLQVADVLHVSHKTLANWRSKTRAGEPTGPPFVKAGRLVRYWSDDVAE